MDVQEVARHRFLYDFSESNSGFSAMSFGDLSSRTLRRELTDRDGLEAALTATSLANFRVRHCDTRTSLAASAALTRALAILSQALRASRPQVTLNIVLTAILLGLHQNISHERHLIGSWVHHFRGSVNLLEAAADDGIDEAIYIKLSKLMKMQALCFSLSAELPIPLPSRMRRNLNTKTDLRSRTLALAARTADFCARVRKRNPRLNVDHRFEVRDEATVLTSAFHELECELEVALPYHSQDSHNDLYPKWYHPISTFLGGPEKIHLYAALKDVGTWNIQRMTYMRLQSLFLDYELCDYSLLSATPERQCEALDSAQMHTAKLLKLVEDLSASIYYTLSHQADGLQPLTSFDEIAGSKAYSLLTPITMAIQSLKSLSSSVQASERLEWLTHVLNVFKEKFGISDAWCWRDGDEDKAKILIEQQLSFDG